ncbi:MAG: zinc metallopeptidase [Gammaproteobacteria bacterium]
MHPVLLLIPATALVIAPRIWVNKVLRQHNHTAEDLPLTATELARQLLDKHQLQTVKVEQTDLGDHYDPHTRTVRLARDKFDRKSLTALTTAAHEVAHAIQHASDYGPFIWRMRMLKVARVTGEAGFILLLSAPVSAMLSREPLPPIIIGSAAFAMLGTGTAVQLVSLPSELDASFRKALPLLQQGYISEQQSGDARKILIACSLTYVASSLVSVLNIWPWLGRGPALQTQQFAGLLPTLPTTHSRPQRHGHPANRRRRMQTGYSTTQTLVRGVGKPLIRGWMRLTRSH